MHYKLPLGSMIPLNHCSQVCVYVCVHQNTLGIKGIFPVFVYTE